MKEMLMNLAVMEIENTIGSKVDGRRNWVIRMETWGEKRVIAYRGGFGKADRGGWLSARLTDIGEKKIRWYEFTYKKDYMAALNKIKEGGAYDWYESFLKW